MRSSHALTLPGEPDRTRTTTRSVPILFLPLVGGALLVLAVFAVHASPGFRPVAPFRDRWLATRSDTDSVAVKQSLSLDSLVIDSIQIDTAVLDSVDADSAARSDSLIRRYIPPVGRDGFASSFRGPRKRPLSAPVGAIWSHKVEIDSLGRYVARDQVGKSTVRYPSIVDRDYYQKVRLQTDLMDNWKSLVDQQQLARQQQSRGGLGLNIVVPGGRQSAFSTIFGKPQVDLRVTGQAYIQAGFDYRKSDQQAQYSGQASRVDPTFKQDLSLGINGSIGDKMHVDVSWDTQNQFDYQNQIKLYYQGYEDEIIQRIEAGNVFLETPSTLIRGGQSLFGIKSELQLGGIHLTTVASQQEGQANSLSIKGGATASEFSVRSSEYEKNAHFFLSYFFRNTYEEALSNPPNITLFNGFDRITDIELWILPSTPISGEETNSRFVISMVDLGEPKRIVSEADEFTNRVLPNENIDEYSTDSLDIIARSTEPQRDLGTLRGLRDQVDFQSGRFKKLTRGVDYDLDPYLGYVSLTNRLDENEALAVAFKYTANGVSYQVGEFSGQGGGSGNTQKDRRLVLKLLRPALLQQPAPATGFNPAAWYLQLRNIYRLGTSLSLESLELDVEYQPPGKSPQKILPGVADRKTLLWVLGLDRLNADEAPVPDDQFDKLVGTTIEPRYGRLIFPYLEPFGSRISTIIDETGTESAKENKELYIYDRLYSEKQENAEKDTQHDVYVISGAFSGSTQAYYDLKAYAGLVPNSVRVTAGGTPLQENADFVVDYQGGSVTITNPAYLSSGREINITYEQNQFLNIQKKTLLGARAAYELDDRFSLGSTIFRLTQKSPVDKFRVGEEPVSNTIWGLDANVALEPRWLTRAVDALPLIQTKAPSSFTLKAEYAQLIPGQSETIAFTQTRRNLQKEGRDFSQDELNGVSYIDDFEGFENTYSLKQPGSWVLAAAPDSIAAVDPNPGDPENNVGTEFVLQRNAWRGRLGWYQTNPNLITQLFGRNATIPASVAPPQVEDVFNREEVSTSESIIYPLDLYFDPSERGPYNYTNDFKSYFEKPEFTWGGITQRIPAGYNDFSQKSIEFIEFIFRPFAENEGNDTGHNAKLFINLGQLAEDIVPNGQLNSEDGLVISSTNASLDAVGLSRLPNAITNNTLNIDPNTNLAEDLGLDGLASFDPAKYGEASEQTVLASFLAGLNAQAGAISDPRYAAEIAKANADPSGDDYHNYEDDNFYRNAEFYPNGATLQQRFSHYFSGTELNSYEGQQELDQRTSSPRGNSRYPDTEDLNLNSSADTKNAYYEYEIPLSRAVLDAQAQPGTDDDYVVTELVNQNGPTGWYQVRIPVRQYTRKAGDIEGFDTIQFIRLWTTGHHVPATVRFVSFDLVGSQWQKSADIPVDVLDPREAVTDSSTYLTISSVNNEENAAEYVTPAEAVVSQIQLATQGGQSQKQREQSLQLDVQNLRAGNQLAVFKPYLGEALDLLKYNSLRMFTHLHGTLGGGKPLSEYYQEQPDSARNLVKLFVRLGMNQTNDYYEYEQPLTPSPEGTRDADALWMVNQALNGQTGVNLNSMVLKLSQLNQLQIARDDEGAPTDTIYWNLDAAGAVKSGAPDATEYAPTGTRLGVKGRPSLSRINTIVIGLRNGADVEQKDDFHVIEKATVWLNEMRVAGYDATGGQAGLVSADIALADLGRVRGNFQKQTDGFGELSSTLDDRNQTAFQNWGVTADMNLDKFIPTRFGWALPLSFQVQSNTSTPRYSPARSDVQLDDIIEGIENNDNLDAATKEQKIQEATEAAQTHSFNRSFTARVQKTGSKSPILRNTLDGIGLTYTYSDANSRNPSLRQNNSWRWSAGLTYRFASRRPKTVRPFWFTDNLPVVDLLGDLRFNYLPAALTWSGTAARNYGISQERQDPYTEGVLPDIVDYPLREQHGFTHRRSFSLQYNPFAFLNLSFDTATDQSLNSIGVDTTFSVVMLDTTTHEFRTLDGTRLRQALADGLIQNPDSSFEVSRLNLIPTDRIINRVLNGAASPRTTQYSQRFTGTFQPKFAKALSWVQLQPVTYSVDYDWQNAPLGRAMGATVNMSMDLRSGVTLRPQEMWRKFGWYQAIEKAQRDAETAAERERSQREAEKKRLATQRAREKELARLEEEKKKKEEAAREAQDPENEEEQVEEKPEENEQQELPKIEEPAQTRSARNRRPNQTPPGGETAPAGETARADTLESKGFRLPLPNFKSLIRRSVLALTGITDITITYQNSQSSASTNVGRIVGHDVFTDYTLLDALRGQGPSIAYRFGLARHIPLEQRSVLSSLQVTDDYSDAQKVAARTTWQPTKNLQVSLNWTADWGSREAVTFTTDQDGDGFPDQVYTESGTSRASIWSFGANFKDMFVDQYNTLREDFERRPTTEDTEIRDYNGDGRIVLTNKSMVDDFQKTFVSSVGTLDSYGYLPVPLPGWTVTYNGISRWPIIRALVQNASLRHAYSSDYATDFRTSVTSAGAEPSFRLSDYTIFYTHGSYEAGTVRINERYTPLIGVDLTLKGRITANIAYNKTNSYSLTPTTSDIGEMKTNEIAITAGFQHQGLKIPFLPIKRLNNRITFNLTVAFAKNHDQRYNLNTAIRDALPFLISGDALQADSAITLNARNILTDTNRLTVTPRISYQFSNRVSADFALKYEAFKGDARQLSYTNVTGNFNVRVSISN